MPTTHNHPIYLNCPYRDKDAAKALGARFDGTRKQWFIPSGLDITPFRRWLPPETVAELQTGIQPLAHTNADSDAATGVRLADLLTQVKQRLEQYYADSIWVRAVVVQMSSSRGHVYLELADHDDEGNEIAKTRAMLWRERVDYLLNRFAEQTGMPFSEDLNVLLLVQVTFHPVYGFALDILDLDPRFTLGELEAKNQRIRVQLQQEGVFERNRQLPSTDEFCRVAVIAPPQAAGLGDFRSQADQLAALGLCQFCYYEAAFQGKNNVVDIPAAFAQVQHDHTVDTFDCIVVIRGGGAKADLLQLNEYAIVNAVCRAPIPVLVGIGHERDETLLDEVANLRCATPSLVIAHISSTLIDNARRAARDWQRIQQATAAQLQNAKWHCQTWQAQIREHAFQQLHQQRYALRQQLQTIQQQAQYQLQQQRLLNERRYQIIHNQAILQLQQQRQQLTQWYQQVLQGSATQLQNTKQQLKLLMEMVLLGDPQRALQRGYVIVRDKQDNVVTDKTTAQQVGELVLAFKDGRLVVEVVT